MTWAPGVPIPAKLWPIGEAVVARLWDGRPIKGKVARHATLYSLEVEIAGGKALVPTSLIEGGAERLASHLADLALG